MSVPDLAAAAAEIAATLNQADGVLATTDDRNINPPCVLVVLDTLNLDRLGAGPVSVSWVLWLIAADHGRPAAMGALSSMADAVSGVFPPTGDITADTIALPAGQTLPGLRWPIETTVTND